MRTLPVLVGLVLTGSVLLAGGLALAGPQAPTAAGGAAARPEAPARATTILFVRHAEKDAASDPKDPGLSSAGRERAAALAALCARAQATHLFSSEFRRTRETLAPLAQVLGLEVRALPAGRPEELVAALDALPDGSVAVVAGHSNTVPDLLARLGGEARDLVTSGGVRMLPDDAYDRLYVLTRPPRAARALAASSTLELRYGP